MAIKILPPLPPLPPPPPLSLSMHRYLASTVCTVAGTSITPTDCCLIISPIIKSGTVSVRIIISAGGASTFSPPMQKEKSTNASALDYFWRKKADLRKNADLVMAKSHILMVISTWGVKNKVESSSLSFARYYDGREGCEFLSKHGDFSQSEIFAKIENVEGLDNQEADLTILSHGNLGIDLPPEKVLLYKKSALKCDMAGNGKHDLRATCSEADVATAVLDDAGLRRKLNKVIDYEYFTKTPEMKDPNEFQPGSYQVQSPQGTVILVNAPDQVEAPQLQVPLKFEQKAERVFNQDVYYKKTIKFVRGVMTHLETTASSAVRASISVKASVIFCFTSSGRAARLIAKYRPTMAVITAVVHRLKTNQLKWSLIRAFEARQSLIVHGLLPMLADPRHHAESTNATNEPVL